MERADDGELEELLLAEKITPGPFKRRLDGVAKAKQLLDLKAFLNRSLEKVERDDYSVQENA